MYGPAPPAHRKEADLAALSKKAWEDTAQLAERDREIERLKQEHHVRLQQEQARCELYSSALAGATDLLNCWCREWQSEERDNPWTEFGLRECVDKLWNRCCTLRNTTWREAPEPELERLRRIEDAARRWAHDWSHEAEDELKSALEAGE